MTQKFIYRCVNCDKEYDASQIRYLCPSCNTQNQEGKPLKGVLKVLYNYEDLKKHNYSSLNNRIFNELSPILEGSYYPKLRIGKTPCYKYNNLPDTNNFTVFIKDDSQNPTFSFKDRASGLVSAYAKQMGISKIAAASTGNAGSSMAGICASQNQQAVIFVPAAAPIAKLTQIKMYGAAIIPVNGTYDDAFDLSIKASEQFNWYNRNTAYNPLTVEGKKTVSFEIFEQFGKKLPDNIFVPTGDGVIIAGVYKGFEDLLKLGLIDKIPSIFAVQVSGSNNLISNLDTNNPIFKSSNTIADSISVDIPRNYYMAKDFLNKYHGKGVEVSDSDVINASLSLSKTTGIFSEPAAAASYAGLKKAITLNLVKSQDINLILLTGSGLKDLMAVNKHLPEIKPIDCSVNEVKKLLQL